MVKVTPQNRVPDNLTVTDMDVYETGLEVPYTCSQEPDVSLEPILKQKTPAHRLTLFL
jgi:hypothetical protein